MSRPAIPERITSLRERLERGAPGEEQRETIRNDLVRVVQDIDAEIERLEALRESIRPLAERYKELFPRRAGGPVERIDHLGASTFRERGWSAMAGGEYEEAAGHLRRATELDPGDVAARAMLGWAYLHLALDEEGAGHIEAALQLDPEHCLARVIQAFALIRGGAPDAALESLGPLAGAGCQDRTARLYANLYQGLAYAALERYREACTALKSAIELGPNLTEAYWELGRLHAAEGRHDLALEIWRAGAENRFNRWGDRCRAELLRAEEEEGGDDL